MISIIVAIDKNNGIGKNNELLTYIKEDLQYFKKTTNYHIVVMGYNTWLSLPKKPLPGRVNVVLAEKGTKIDTVIVVNNIDELLNFISLCDDEVFIIGGASIYKQMIQYADKLYVTHIFENFNADVFFPEIDNTWKITNVIADKININHEHPHIFTIYEKNKEEIK